jgi:putative aldouronate transport system substrate-binding protein
MKKFTVLALCALTALAVSCSGGDKGVGVYTDGKGEILYPIETDKRVSFVYQSDATKIPREEAPIWQEIEKRTGIGIDWVTRPGDDSHLTLLFASGSIPDIIDAYWNLLPGGASGYANQGYLSELSGIIDSYMPNYKALLDSNEDYKKQTVSDDGKYYYVPWYREKEELLTYAGPIIRKDLLDKAGLEAPVTVDDWYEALTAFKAQLNIDVPLTMEFKTLQLFFSGAYALTNDQEFTNDFRLDETGKVVYGPTQPVAKEAYKTMAKWYKEGLIDPNLFSLDGNTVTAKMTTGAAGASYAYLGGGIGRWTQNHDTAIEGYNLIGVRPAVLKAGDAPMLGQRDFYENGVGLAISPKDGNQALAGRFLDFFFTEEGKTLYNYGIKDVSYDLVDGKPVIKQEYLQMNSKDAITYYVNSGGMGIQLWDAYRQGLLYPAKQENAALVWGDTDTEKYRMPKISVTEDESGIISPILADINTYKKEMISKFILGNEDVDAKFDTFVQTINNFGLDKVLKIKQAEVDRYNAR